MPNQHRSPFVRQCLDSISAMGLIAKDQYDVRLDDGEAMFFERQLEAVEGRLYEKKFRELKYRDLIPINNGFGLGHLVITYYLWNKVGMAKVIANPTDDPPRADAFATRHTANVRPIGSSFGFSTQDLRHAQAAGVALEMRKVDAVRRSVRVKENDIAWNGDAEYGLTGFLANPNIPQAEVAQSAEAGNPTEWTGGKTPDEIIADVRGAVSTIRDTTNGVHEADTMLLPITEYDHIALTPRSDKSDLTILEFLTKPGNSFGLTRIDWLTELKESGPGNANQMVLYERDSEVLEMFIPMEMQPLPPERRNYSFIVNVEAENAGVVVRYPLAATKFYGI